MLRLVAGLSGPYISRKQQSYELTALLMPSITADASHPPLGGRRVSRLRTALCKAKLEWLSCRKDTEELDKIYR